MTEPFKLGCHCGFLASDPQAFLDHCLMTQHIPIDPGEEDGAMAELVQMFATVQGIAAQQKDGLDPELPAGMELSGPLTEADILNDEELTDEQKQDILARFAAVRALDEKKE